MKMMKFDAARHDTATCSSIRKKVPCCRKRQPAWCLWDCFFFPSIKFTDLTKFHTRFFKKRWTSMNSFAKTVGPVGSGPRVDHESVYGHYAGQNVAELLEESGCVRVSCFDQNRRKVSICKESDVQSVNFLILVLHPLILPVSICCILISWSVAQGVASAVAESHAQGAGAAAQKLLPDLLCLLGRNIIPTKEKYGLNLIFWRTNWYGPNTFHLLIAETSCVYSALLHSLSIDDSCLGKMVRNSLDGESKRKASCWRKTGLSFRLTMPCGRMLYKCVTK